MSHANNHADKHPLNYNTVPKQLKNDRDIALAAVRHDGWSIKFLHEDMQYDKDIVLAAVHQVLTRISNDGDDDGYDDNFGFLKVQILKGVVGSLVHEVARVGLRWDEGMKEVLDDSQSIQEVEPSDPHTGLNPILLAATSSRMDIGSIFKMIQHKPELISTTIS